MSGTQQTESIDILTDQIEEGLEQLRRPTAGIVLSALSAGLDIGFGPLLMAAAYTLVAPNAGPVVLEFALATLYTVGFIFVVLGRSELFTEHTALAVLPVLDGRETIGTLGRLWVLVFCANVVGGAVFAASIALLTPGFDQVTSAAFVHIAEPFVAMSPVVLFATAVLAGWLMGLLSWLVSAAQETTSRTLFVFIVTFVIGFLHLPHCIAGNVELLLAVFTSAEIGFADYGRFLAVSTIGNVVGGTVFVGLLKYGHVVRSGSKTDVDADE